MIATWSVRRLLLFDVKEERGSDDLAATGMQAKSPGSPTTAKLHSPLKKEPPGGTPDRFPAAAYVLDDVPRRPDFFAFHTVRANRSRRAITITTGAVRAASGIPQHRATIGLPNVRWHDRRHFCGTRLPEMRIDEFAVPCNTMTGARSQCLGTATRPRTPPGSGY
jgi:hypothetical protein